MKLLKKTIRILINVDLVKKHESKFNLVFLNTEINRFDIYMMN